MLREHAQLWHSLDATEAKIAADGASAAVLDLCHQLLVQLAHHNMKEERILYAEAERAVPQASLEQLADFLESGRLPDGWVCIKARA